MPARISISLDELVLLQAEARGFSFLPKQPVHSLLSGRHTSRLRGRGLAFEELRHYHPGDDVRTIDWKATARQRSPFVRVYNEERERPVLLLVDQRTPMFFGSQRAMKSVTACEVASLAAWRTLFSGDRIGAIVFNDHEMVELNPQRSQSRVLRILHELERMNSELADPPSNGASISLNHVLDAASRRARHDHLVVLISDLDGADEETQRLATRIASHNDMLVAAVYDPLGASLHGHPGMIATDDKGPVNIPTDGHFPKRFQDAFESLLGRWTSIFRSLSVPILPITTASEPAEQLRDLFGRSSKA